MCHTSFLLFPLLLLVFDPDDLAFVDASNVRAGLFEDLSKYGPESSSNIPFLATYDFSKGKGGKGKSFALMLDPNKVALPESFSSSSGGGGSSKFQPFQNYTVSVSIFDKDCERQVEEGNSPMFPYNLELSLVIVQMSFAEDDDVGGGGGGDIEPPPPPPGPKADQQMTEEESLLLSLLPPVSSRRRQHSLVTVDLVRDSGGAEGSNAETVGPLTEEREQPDGGVHFYKNKFLFKTWVEGTSYGAFLNATDPYAKRITVSLDLWHPYSSIYMVFTIHKQMRRHNTNNDNSFLPYNDCPNALKADFPCEVNSVDHQLCIPEKDLVCNGLPNCAQEWVKNWDENEGQCSDSGWSFASAIQVLIYTLTTIALLLLIIGFMRFCYFRTRFSRQREEVRRIMSDRVSGLSDFLSNSLPRRPRNAPPTYDDATKNDNDGFVPDDEECPPPAYPGEEGPSTTALSSLPLSSRVPVVDREVVTLRRASAAAAQASSSSSWPSVSSSSSQQQQQGSRSRRTSDCVHGETCADVCDTLTRDGERRCLSLPPDPPPYSPVDVIYETVVTEAVATDNDGRPDGATAAAVAAVTHFIEGDDGGGTRSEEGVREEAKPSEVRVEDEAGVSGDGSGGGKRSRRRRRASSDMTLRP